MRFQDVRLRIFRAVTRWGSVVGEKLSTTAVLGIVAEYAAVLGLELSPHDLRRTCARLCRLSGGALEQIQFLCARVSLEKEEENVAILGNLLS
jgi:integrase